MWFCLWKFVWVLLSQFPILFLGFSRTEIHGIDQKLVEGPLKILKVSRTKNNHIQVYNKVRFIY